LYLFLDPVPARRGKIPSAGDLLRPQGDEMTSNTRRQPVPGTVIFDGVEAQKGYALNKMCYSLNSAANRAAFGRDEEKYCARYGLNAAQRAAVAQRNVLALIAAGGNVYYLAKLAVMFGLNVQDIGAQQTGMSVEDFKARLVAAGRGYPGEKQWPA
jgi:protocatechuate 4,5-dioxygenase alpha chain